MDVFEKCRNFTAAKDAMERGFYPYFIPLNENEGTEVVFQGQRLIMCGSNNYLGLTTHPKVREAAIEAVKRFGTSCTGSRFLNGTLAMHEQLEAELAEWVGMEAALVFSTGMQTNLGTISALIGRDDVVILDKDDHASIVDGARLGYHNGTVSYRGVFSPDRCRRFHGHPVRLHHDLFRLRRERRCVPRICGGYHHSQ
jgi:7-keto-8-aminopelargonate synthetase-like enzyme